MFRLALTMLTADKPKFYALIFAVASCVFLIAQQVSIFTGLMNRTTSQIKDVAPNMVWVMHPQTVYVDEVKPLADNDLERVRSVAGVESAVKLFKAFARISAPNGNFRLGILLGLDDATLLGAPGEMLLGSAADLKDPDALIIDDQGFRSLFPGRELAIGDMLELNDRKARIVGICKPRPPFQTFPVIYSKFSDAQSYIGRERRSMGFVLAKPLTGMSLEELAVRISAQTGLKAMPASRFAAATIWYYVGNTGIPVNFGLTISVAVLVGAIITGQTFYLFVLENLKPLAALKAIGAADGLLSRMILLQAGYVAALGIGLGIGLTAVFFEATGDIPHLRLFLFYWPTALGTSVLVMTITILVSIIAVRKVTRVEPGIVFKG